MFDRKFDVIVVGSGHAGCEAANAASKLGAKTLLIGLNLDNLAWMPCNPAIGGPAKSHLVKEIDALDGLMGLAADQTHLQIKTLNISRGAASQALRAQTDKYQYSQYINSLLRKVDNLSFYQAIVSEVLIDLDQKKIKGIKTQLGEKIFARSVVLTSGTFLQGKVFVGKESRSSGRSNEPAAIGLTQNLQSYGLEFGRLKTGTPPRIDKRSIDFSKLEIHKGDRQSEFFSFLPNRPTLKQVPCYATRTNSLTRKIIFDNLEQSPIYGGLIESKGPRYCPSIEDKFTRFKDKDSHLLFLEFEGENTNEVYLQGFSTSLPVNVQWQMVRSLNGLEKAEIIRPAYAIEYDFLRSRQFRHNLESKTIKGLFAAGQILGSSGYEEAAAQGLAAGINAAKFSQEKEEVIFYRNQSYLGTLIDNLISKEITEPYRMMTSRSEYRIFLRQDNADQRLTEIGRKIGLVSDFRWEVFQKKMGNFQRELDLLEKERLRSCLATNQILKEFQETELKENQSITLKELLRRPKVSYDLIDKFLKRDPEKSKEIPRFSVQTAIKYAGYVKRQEQEIQKFEKLSKVKIPKDFNFERIKHLSGETQEKLLESKPDSVSKLFLLEGIRASEISQILLFLRKLSFSKTIN